MKRDIELILYERYYDKFDSIKTIIESKRQVIIESQEEIYKEELRKFFPTLFNMIKGNIQTFIPILANPLKSEQIVLNKYIKNLDFEVRINHDPARNAYTYPWIGSGIGATLTSVPIVGTLGYFTNGFYRVFKEQQLLEPTIINDTVSFPNSKGLKVLAFQTKGLLTDLTERQRAAIMLHEIGHWYRAKSALTSSFLSVTSSLLNEFKAPILIMFPPLAFGLFILCNLVSRHAEKSADMFAKRCGFGNDAADALDRILLRPRNDTNIINKVGDWIVKIIMSIQNVLDKVVPFLFDYPSAEKRIAYLRDNKQLTDHMLLEDLEIIERLINEGKLQDVALKLLVKPLNMIDQLVAKNVKVLFPL